MTMQTVNGMAVHASAAKADLSIRFTPEQEALILETCCGGATKSEANALLAIAEARGLNPILGECYFVKRYDQAKGREVWAVQASIDSFRIKAEQTGLYAGQDEPEYEYDEQGNLTLARVRVWRKDWPRPAIGVARWSEYVQTKKDRSPTKFWAQMPHNQLAKCAEALALRKAFPAVLAKIYTAEEMAQADNPEPVAQMQPAPVAKALSAASVVDAEKQGATFQRLAERIDVAESDAALNDVAKDAVRAHKGGLLSDGHLASIKAAVTGKRRLVREASSPKPVDDGPTYDDSEQEEP